MYYYLTNSTRIRYRCGCGQGLTGIELKRKRAGGLVTKVLCRLNTLLIGALVKVRYHWCMRQISNVSQGGGWISTFRLTSVGY